MPVGWSSPLVSSCRWFPRLLLLHAILQYLTVSKILHSLWIGCFFWYHKSLKSPMKLKFSFWQKKTEVLSFLNFRGCRFIFMNCFPVVQQQMAKMSALVCNISPLTYHFLFSSWQPILILKVFTYAHVISG